MAKDQRKGVPVLPAVPEDEIRQEVIADDNTRYVLHLRRQVLEQYVLRITNSCADIKCSTHTSHHGSVKKVERLLELSKEGSFVQTESPRRIESYGSDASKEHTRVSGAAPSGTSS
ncbi:hypothetical protein M8J76_014374 [Diaphorina citri]|nr:hypothetical protein M8J76_014374 [Diaphorina citri]